MTKWLLAAAVALSLQPTTSFAADASDALDVISEGAVQADQSNYAEFVRPGHRPGRPPGHGPGRPGWGRPHPRPPGHRPPPPHYPPPHRPPPRPQQVACFAENNFGQVFEARGYDVNYTQQNALNACYRYSSYCRPTGCRQTW